MPKINPATSVHMYKLHRCQRVVIVALALLLHLFVASQPAYAHVDLVRSEPEDGATLVHSPTEMRLWFSEPVSNEFTSVHLIDQNDQEVSGVSIAVRTGEASTIYVNLPTLSNGHYTLLWKTMSGIDGHVNQGFSLFSIGTDPATTRMANPTRPADPAVKPSLMEATLRWANYLLLASIAGALALYYGVLATVESQTDLLAKQKQQRMRRRLLGWAAFCASGGFMVGFGLLLWQITAAQGSTISSEMWLPLAKLMLTGSHWGLLWIVRQALLLLLSIGLWTIAIRPAEASSTWLHLAVSGRIIDLMIVQALAGHTTSSSSNWLFALLNTTIHLLSTGIWIGGVLTLAVIILPAMRGKQQTGGDWHPLLWKSFSQMAALSVGLIIITGLYSAGHSVASLDALITTFYGQLLIGKVGLVLLTGLCGLGNALLLHPTLAALLARRLGWPAGWSMPMHTWPRLLALEVALGILIFGITGLLTASSPARGVEYTIAPGDIQPLKGQRVDGLFFTLAVTPNHPGKNLISVHITRDQTAEVEDVPQVKMRIANGNGTSPFIPVRADREDATHFPYDGETFDKAGNWTIEVVAIRTSKGTTVAHFNWVVAPTATVQPVVISKYPLQLPLTVAAGTALIMLIVGLIAWQFRRRVHPPIAPSVVHPPRTSLIDL